MVRRRSLAGQHERVPPGPGGIRPLGELQVDPPAPIDDREPAPAGYADHGVRKEVLTRMPRCCASRRAPHRLDVAGQEGPTALQEDLGVMNQADPLVGVAHPRGCLLYTSDAADDLLC